MISMKRLRFETYMALPLPALTGFGSSALEISAEDTRPNIQIALIVADDLGHADLGSYGGEIQTPNIHSLARESRLFTQFHTALLCAPTAAMLLSGNKNQVAGMERQGGPRRLKVGRP